ncbi:MAG: UTP--glucose-1-phosphate uridylyltransferase [Planctomycetales bacterium]|jgi:UTP--glucose-1-phosphate uridylyltransferase|nr:UTP--glucose-1-phosphate uridylyltransferase [Planctomycetales bacterium]
MMINLALIPVAGWGTRMLPATKSQPKEMLPIGRKPVVQFVVEELVQSGIRRLLFITGQGKTSIENHFDLDASLVAYLRDTGREEQLRDLQFARQDVEYFYTRQRQQLGLGHAVLCGQAMIGQQPFVVALGDSIIGLHAQSQNVSRMTAIFESEKADVVLAFDDVSPQEVVHFGIALPKGTPGDIFEVADLIEKPSVNEAPSTLAAAGRYVFSPAIFEALAKTQPGRGGEIQLTDAIRLLLNDGRKVLGVRLTPQEKRFDIGNFESYFQAFFEFALHDPQHGPALRDHVQKLLDSFSSSP